MSRKELLLRKGAELKSVIDNQPTMAEKTRGGLFGAGGRFKGGTDPVMEKFNESIHFDKR